MTQELSPNTQAILLLTAPLIAGRGSSSTELLTPGEYKRLARHLREINHQPADLLAADNAELLRACQTIADADRLRRLLGRGFLLSQVVERWQARAIWVVSRADVNYPARLKTRLRDDAPAVLYGCGNIGLFEAGGLAVVGSRQADDALIDYAMNVGGQTARAGRILVSGGARGIDLAAMRGALEAGGRAGGVLADSLERTALEREHRNLLLDGRLALVSPYDPGAGFNVGNAMQRNKLIYALADAALVVSADLNAGGTWAGAIEQLERYKFEPVYVRSTGASMPGLDALLRKGALAWPNPDPDAALADLLDEAASTEPRPTASTPSLFPASGPSDGGSPPSGFLEPAANPESIFEPAPEYSVSAIQSEAREAQVAPGDKPDAGIPSETLFAVARGAILRVAAAPVTSAQIADVLGVSTAQAGAWLNRLVAEGTLERLSKPVRYVRRGQATLLG
ncbi:MAG: DNA-processing protein DprA [Thermoflexales bacterium]